MALRLKSLLGSDNVQLGPLLQNGIRTAPDLLAHNPKALFTQFPRGTATVHDIEQLQASAAHAMCAPCSIGDEGLDADDIPPLRTGLDALDALLRGFETHDVFELAGPSSAGKTALAMTIVARELASHPGAAVLWLDTKSAFSPERMLHIIQNNAQNVDVEAILDRIHVAQCRDVPALYDAVDAIFSSPMHVRLLVIDRIGDVLLSSLTNKQPNGYAVIATFMRHLAASARSRGFTAVLLNSAIPSPASSSAFRNASFSPALAPMLATYTAGTLWLNTAVDAFGRENVRPVSDDAILIVVEVLNSNVSTSGQWTLVKLVNGIRFEQYDERGDAE
ncbi:P-loop containing nucleoside triphosphate hydrolase protein [Exidia glandulosa HHB12029]|uniref:p-loop containing nucleoside triphosphate hydrolase protein n=1 Tax=Exidia glandulosa HHB12029 TaxID=1314781 RepID=A0A165BCE9_EXIGL|nr:P-loop containing nucleoside triphosphate hydrolase protein [Exidia glandulosa HHB12029]KZV86532.1 P-loop containing nucleoside triphosphate hydrolase protein [Exidia glandulosa HHB12029]